MTMRLYALYDRVAEECGPVWTAKSDAVAVRNARNGLKEARLDEWFLYCLGSFDPEKVELHAIKATQVPLQAREDV